MLGTIVHSFSYASTVVFLGVSAIVALSLLVTGTYRRWQERQCRAVLMLGGSSLGVGQSFDWGQNDDPANVGEVETDGDEPEVFVEASVVDEAGKPHDPEGGSPYEARGEREESQRRLGLLRDKHTVLLIQAMRLRLSPSKGHASATDRARRVFVEYLGNTDYEAE